LHCLFKELSSSLFYWVNFKMIFHFRFISHIMNIIRIKIAVFYCCRFWFFFSILLRYSAGIGRTGAFIAVHYLYDRAEREQRVNIFECVKTMREQRINMVQTPVCVVNLLFTIMYCMVRVRSFSDLKLYFL
jgi:protein tyrosine phosphatase